MYIEQQDFSNLQKRLKLVEDRLSYFENCYQLQEKKVLELSRQFDSALRQIQDLNLGHSRYDDRTENSLQRIEKGMLLMQKELSLIEANQNEKINQLIQQLVEPSLKDIDYQIKQESQSLMRSFQKQLDKLYDELSLKIKSGNQQQPLPQNSFARPNQDDVKKKIDEEIDRRIQEENERRRNALESESKHHKSGQMSTEKSRAREIQNRLNLERKTKQDKINQLNELYQYRKH